MRSFVRFVALILLAAGSTNAQHGGHSQAMEASVRPAAAQCVMRLLLRPEEGIAETWMDLAYTNRTTSDISELRFSLSKDHQVTIDSVLYLGAPLDSSRMQTDDNILMLRILLKPGEMAPLLMSFKTRISELKEIRKGGQAVFLDHWYPKLLVAEVSEEGSKEPNKPEPEICDFRLEIKTDSSVQVAVPGTFINEIESFGPVSDRIDTIYYDPQDSLFPANNPFPSFISYYCQLTGAENCALAIFRVPSIVRIMYKQQRVDLYSSSRVARKDQERIAGEIDRITRATIGYLGPIPDGRMAVYFDRQERPDLLAGKFAYICTGSRDPRQVITQFAVAMAYQYFNRVQGSVESTPWSDGAAIWVAATVLHDLYGDDGYTMMESWLDQVLPEREIHSPLSAAPFGWMNDLRKPNRPWGQDDSLLFLQYFVTPSALQIVAAYTSIDSMMSALRRYSLENRNRHPQATELPKSVASEIGEDWSSRLGPMVEAERPFDWSLRDVKVSKSASGFLISAAIVATSDPNLPIEVAIVTGTDTTVSLQSLSKEKRISTFFGYYSAARPSSIVLDPHYKLPDQNRQNNIYNANAINLRLRNAPKQFPTFKRFTRGD
jgi:hypothetical protein